MCIVVHVNILLVWSDGCCLNFEINKLYRVIFVGRVYAIPSVCVYMLILTLLYLYPLCFSVCGCGFALSKRCLTINLLIRTLILGTCTKINVNLPLGHFKT